MRILITGISGFVGRHLARELEGSGARVFGLAKEAPRTVPGAEEVFEGDLLEPGALRRAIGRAAPEVVVHLAALSHVGRSWACPREYLRVNVHGTRHLLEAAGERRLIFASSSEVYGVVPPAQQPISEQRPVDPRTPYAVTKICGERLALRQGAIVARSFNAVGAGQAGHFALPSFAAQLAAIAQGDREAVLHVGDLSPRRDFYHVADAAAAYRVLIERGVPGTVYNIASGEAPSIREALDRLCRIAGMSPAVRPDPARMRPVDIALLCGDSRRLAALGWQPRYGFDDALRDVWQEALDARQS